jgi:hypothetical protein
MIADTCVRLRIAATFPKITKRYSRCLISFRKWGGTWEKAERFGRDLALADREVYIRVGKDQRFRGSVAKNGWGRKKPGPDFSSDGNLGEALHKSHFPLNDAFAYSFNLPFFHHMHRLITFDSST